MPGIELAESPEQLWCDGNLACLVIFGFWNQNDESFPVDVTWFDGQGLTEPETTLVNDGEKSSESVVAKGA